MSLTGPRLRFIVASTILATVLAGLSTAASGSGMPSDAWVGSFSLGSSAQGGTLGDVFAPVGWLFAIEAEGPGRWHGRALIAADYFSVPLRPAGQLISATNDTLLGGSIARLLLCRVGARRYLLRGDSWSPYVDGGIGLGMGSADFTTSDPGFAGTGTDGTLVWDLFLGAGARTRRPGPIAGFGDLRLDDPHSLRGKWALIVSARVGLAITLPELPKAFRFR